MAQNIVQKDDGTVQIQDGASSTSSTATLQEVMEIGRGTTDLDITYIALRNASGTKTYIYAAANGTSITVTPTKP